MASYAEMLIESARNEFEDILEKMEYLSENYDLLDEGHKDMYKNKENYDKNKWRLDRYGTSGPNMDRNNVDDFSKRYDTSGKYNDPGKQKRINRASNDFRSISYRPERYRNFNTKEYGKGKEYVDHSNIKNAENLTPEQKKAHIQKMIDNDKSKNGGSAKNNVMKRYNKQNPDKKFATANELSKTGEENRKHKAGDAIERHNRRHPDRKLEQVQDILDEFYELI